MALLEGDELREALATLPGWELEGNAIVRQFDFPNFVEAIAFVDRVADRAEAMNHHPDIAIHYNRVALTLWTHSEGGVTQKDIDGARSFAEAAG